MSVWQTDKYRGVQVSFIPALVCTHYGSNVWSCCRNNNRNAWNSNGNNGYFNNNNVYNTYLAVPVSN